MSSAHRGPSQGRRATSFSGGGAIERSPLFRPAQTRSPEFESQRNGSFRTEGRVQRMQASRWTGTEGVPSRERDSHRPDSRAGSLHGGDPLDEHCAELDPDGRKVRSIIDDAGDGGGGIARLRGIGPTVVRVREGDARGAQREQDEKGERTYLGSKSRQHGGQTPAVRCSTPTHLVEAAPVLAQRPFRNRGSRG